MTTRTDRASCLRAPPYPLSVILRTRPSATLGCVDTAGRAEKKKKKARYCGTSRLCCRSSSRARTRVTPARRTQISRPDMARERRARNAQPVLHPAVRRNTFPLSPVCESPSVSSRTSQPTVRDTVHRRPTPPSTCAAPGARACRLSGPHATHNLTSTRQKHDQSRAVLCRTSDPSIRFLPFCAAAEPH